MVCRDVEEERDDIEEVSSCDEESVSRVGLKVVAMEPLEAIAIDIDFFKSRGYLGGEGRGDGE